MPRFYAVRHGAAATRFGVGVRAGWVAFDPPQRRSGGAELLGFDAVFLEQLAERAPFLAGQAGGV